MSSAVHDRLLYRAYADANAHAKDLYTIYRELYPSLEEISIELPIQDPYAFEYCTNRRYFVLVVPYTARRELLVEVSFSDQRLTRRLLGGSLHRAKMETYIDAVNRLASHDMRGIELGEVEPIAFLRNRFVFDSQEWTHYGVAFVARIRNADPHALLNETVHARRQLIPYDDTNVPFGLLHNQSVAHIARQRIATLDITKVPESEIAQNLRYAGRYRLHDALVKPFFKLFGPPFTRCRVQDIDATLERSLLAGDHGKVLDVACGENKAVIDWAKLPGASLTVGNDVSWSQIKLMAERCAPDELRNTNSVVLFTNHDARALPFADRYFDFVVCKNVLHHMPTLESVRELISEVVRVGKRAIIVEIMDPAYEGLWGRLRHRYYMHWLHDAGEHFLSREAFAALTEMTERTKTFEMSTVRGVYLFAMFGPQTAEGDTHA